MANGGSVTIRAILDHSGIDSGTKKVKDELRGVGDGSFDGVQKGADGAGKSTKGLADKASHLGGIMQHVGIAATAGLTVPLVAIGKSAISTASNFDNAMSQVQGALGGAGTDMDGLRQLALQLGADTIFSATEAGGAMVELAKGGLSEADIKSGALAASMNLAAAGGLNLASAANSTVQMMGAFNLKADNAADIANALAGSANASSADVSDLTQAMSQCSAQANLVGWSIQDTAAALGLFADAGITGSDAGTSLKTMIQSLAAPVGKASDLMSALGIEVRDSSGNMKDVSSIAQVLKEKLGGLSAAQRDAALQTIFGSDASRAAAILMQSGSEGLQKYVDATNDSTAAERMAAAQKGDLAWSLENMSGSIETASIALGTALAPTIKLVAGIIGDLAEGFGNLNPGMQTVIATVLMLAAAIGPAALVSSRILKSLKPLGKGLKTVAGFVGSLAKQAKAGIAGMRGLATAEDVAAASTVGASKAMRGLKSALASTGIGLLVVLLGELASKFMDYQEKAGIARDATDGMREAVAASQADYSAAADGADNLASSNEDLAKSADDCIKAQADLAKKIKDTAQETGTNAALAEHYTGIIEELTNKYDENGNKVSLNASEQAKLESAVSGLNDTCGTTYKVIDSVSGVLDTTTDTIKKNTDAWIKNAKAQAAQEAYKESVKQQIENEQKLARTNELLEKSSHGIAEFFIEVPGLIDGTSDSYKGLADKQKTLSQMVDENASAQDYYLGIMEDSPPVIDKTAEATAAATEKTQALSAELQQATSKLSAYSAENPVFASMLEASGMSVDDLAKKMQAAGISVDDLKGGIEKYSSSAQDALGKIVQKSDITLDQMLSNLQENARITQEWGDNLKTLYANAGSQSERAFIDYLSGLGPEYAPIVAGLVDDTTGKMGELTAAFAAGGTAGAMAYLAGVSTLPTEAANAVAPTGPAVAATVADGMNANSFTVANARKGIINAATINPGDVDNSPGGSASGKTYASGQDSAAGAVTTSSDNISKLSADHMSSASGDAWWAGHNMTADSYAQGIGGGQGAAVSSAMSASKQVADHFSSSNGDAWWAGYNMTMGMAEGISSGRSAAVNAAASVAAAAVAASMVQLKENSPSKVMRDVGGNFTKGMAIGIAMESASAENAARRVSIGAVGAAQSGADSASVRMPSIDWYSRRGKYDTASIVGSGQVGAANAARFEAAWANPSVRPASVEQSRRGAAPGDAGITINIESFCHSGSEKDDEELLRRIAQKVRLKRRAGGFA